MKNMGMKEGRIFSLIMDGEDFLHLANISRPLLIEHLLAMCDKRNWSRN